MARRDASRVERRRETVAMLNLIGQCMFEHRHQIRCGAPRDRNLRAIDADRSNLAGMIHAQYVAQDRGILHPPKPLRKLATLRPNASPA